MVGGRLDEDARAPEPAADDDVRADIRHAYERGRRDERAGRRRHPIFMTLTFICAVIGLVVLVLAGLNGSFERGGAVMDASLSIAASRAGPAAKQAADNASQTVRGGAAETPKTGISNGAG